jgi:hypothetical protein
MIVTMLPPREAPIRFGSKADILESLGDVRFTPKADIR